MSYVSRTASSEVMDEEINVGFSREDERSARAKRRAHKNSRKRGQEWDDEDDGWN